MNVQSRLSPLATDPAQVVETIAVVGLGYVGLPVAIALARHFPAVTGFDIAEGRVAALQDGHDWTGEISDGDMASSTLRYTGDADALRDASFIIVTVPTPIDGENRPDLGPMEASCKLIGPRLKPGAVVVFESTVYPGLTEEFCGPLLEAASGLRCGVDFTLGYSPERINPGDRVHRLETIVKIIAGQDDATLSRLRDVYGAVVQAGLHEAPSIKVAEAAKVIENTQRDLNIALMNEVALIFDRMGIRTADVLAAAGTKWNFLPFTPGLVGGHCIGVDPYYLTTAAERVGHRPEVILAGRRINDDMGAFVARKTIKLLIQAGVNVHDARIGILGLTFKENVPDLRNSRVPDIVNELRDYGVEPMVHDPLAKREEAMREYGLGLAELDDLTALDALIYAVDHAAFAGRMGDIVAQCGNPPVLIDVKSRFPEGALLPDTRYWSL